MGLALAEVNPAALAAGHGQAPAARSRPLRFRLFLLAASGLAPLALVLLLSSMYLARERRVDAQSGALDLSRALSTAVDAELRATTAVLENLALTSELAKMPAAALAGPGFSSLALRVARSQGWRTVLVASERGELLMRASEVPSATRGPVEPASMERVIRTGEPAVGSVARGALGTDAFAVRQPVFRDGRLRYVLSAVVPTTKVLGIVSRQQLPATWVVAIYDQDGTRVARSLPSRSSRYSASLEALIKSRGQEGMGITRTLEGVASHTGFSRVRSSQWVVAVGVPASEANLDFYRLLAALGAGTAASLGLLALLAWRMARSISGPIDSLKQAAAALGAGEPVTLPRLGVDELDQVGVALQQAARDRDQATVRRAQAHAERGELMVRVEESLRAQEDASRKKDEFLALLGHELRNPLAPIKNAVQLMELKGEAATAPERRIIQRQLHYVTRLVDDLLDASRITGDRFVINLRPLRPVAALEQTVESLTPTLGRRKLRLEIDPAARPLWVRADEARLVQVFNNLLGNAIKFTEPAGHIDVRMLAQPGTIQVVVRDDGAGMSREEVARAFDLFYQAPAHPRGVNGGLGLGLAIVKSLVEMHSGQVTVTSGGRGQGTSVTLTLPLAPPQGDPTVPLRVTSATAARVLVVDDSEDAADTLAALLTMSGFKVQVAYAPRVALEVAESFRPQVAILDIGLPEMDGYELAGRLRASEAGVACQLIALTGYGQQKDVERAMQAGFDAHLTKPIEPDALFKVLAALGGDTAE